MEVAKYEWIGWVGTVMFALCALPQAIESFRNKHSDGVTWGLLLLWMGGEVATLIYTSLNNYIPLIPNYICNIILIGIIIYYKLYPKRN